MPLLFIDGLNVGTTILQTAERLAVNAVCVGSHGRSNLRKGLVGGVASRVLEGARRPVFVVRSVRTQIRAEAVEIACSRHSR